MYNKYLNATDPFSIFRMKTLPKGSESWNFIIRCRALIINYLTWDIGKGDKALFWEDSWDWHPPIDSLEKPVGVKEKLVKLMGSKVSDYKTKKTLNGSTSWEYKSLDDIYVEPIAKSYMKR